MNTIEKQCGISMKFMRISYVEGQMEAISNSGPKADRRIS
jgi:hypothetical protein